jgi:hypothetical protein
MSADKLGLEETTKKLAFASHIVSPFIAYGLKLISSFIGIKIDSREVGEGSVDVDIFYGEGSSLKAGILIPYVKSYTPQTIPNLPSEKEKELAFDKEAAFPFDIFTALEFWLADQGNLDKPADAYDRHQRLIGAYSLQGKLGLISTPIINAYLVLLRHWIEVRTGIVGKNDLPSGKRCIVVLSHDVDNPVNPGDPRHNLWLAFNSLKKRELKKTVSQIRRSLQRVKFELTTPRQKHWLFREIMIAERKYNFKSTFFFSARSQWEAGTNGYDVAYDIHAPRFKRVFREISDSGMEIGLHASYNAKDNVDFFKREKEILQQASGTEVKGNRHHCWHMDTPFWSTLDKHARVGLGYDSSIAFNETPGFRLGIAFPYFPWNPHTKSAIPVLQIPVMTMDGAYFYREGQTVKDTLERFSSLLSTLKQYDGIASMDWHVRTSYPGSAQYKEWGNAYLAILDLLSADSEVCVQNCQEVMTGYSKYWI